MQLPKGNVVGFEPKRIMKGSKPKIRKDSGAIGVSVIESSRKTIQRSTGKRSEIKSSERSQEIQTYIGKSIGETGNATSPGCEPTIKKTAKKSTSETEITTERNALPMLLEASKISSPEEKLAALNLLDDTLMSLSLVLDSLQKRATKESEIYCPETVKSLVRVSREIRSLTQLKFDAAKEMANLELSRIRLAMEVERHARELLK